MLRSAQPSQFSTYPSQYIDTPVLAVLLNRDICSSYHLGLVDVIHADAPVRAAEQGEVGVELVDGGEGGHGLAVRQRVSTGLQLLHWSRGI